MSTIQVRSMGTYGFDVTSLSGLGLSTTDAATTGAENGSEALEEAEMTGGKGGAGLAAGAGF